MKLRFRLIRRVTVICQLRIANARKVICKMPCEKKSCEKSVKCKRYVYAKLACVSCVGLQDCKCQPRLGSDYSEIYIRCSGAPSNTSCLAHFYSAPQCSHCKRCTSYGNSVRLSVRLSVTRRYCAKTTTRSTVQFALSDSKICPVL